MNLKEFTAISGLPGIYKLLTVRGDGIIVEDYDTKQRQFVATRKHQYSPLQTISVYTSDNSSAPLNILFESMFKQLETNPVPSEKADSKTLRTYFTAVMPNHDPERVHISDIKKALKWFHFLNSRNLLALDPPKEDTPIIDTLPATEKATEAIASI
jgi:hypothetical protein